MVDSKSDLLTVAEVAQRLRVGPNTVRTMIARRELRAVKLGKQWRIHAISVEQLVNGGTNVLGSDSKDAAARQGSGPSPIADRRAARTQEVGREAGGDGRTASGGNRPAAEDATVRLRHGAS